MERKELCFNEYMEVKDTYFSKLIDEDETSVTIKFKKCCFAKGEVKESLPPRTHDALKENSPQNKGSMDSNRSIKPSEDIRIKEEVEDE